MTSEGGRSRMWAQAIDMLTRAERLNRQLFEPSEAGWEPPVDILETPDEVLILAALPGVDDEHVQASIQGGALIVSGRRTLPPELRTAIIHRLELPQGRFHRRIPLPPGRYGAITRSSLNGCLLIRLHKTT